MRENVRNGYIQPTNPFLLFTDEMVLLFTDEAASSFGTRKTPPRFTANEGRLLVLYTLYYIQRREKMRKRQLKETKGLIEYQRRHSKVRPIYLSLLRVFLTEENFFKKVVLA